VGDDGAVRGHDPVRAEQLAAAGGDLRRAGLQVHPVEVGVPVTDAAAIVVEVDEAVPAPLEGQSAEIGVGPVAGDRVAVVPVGGR
jgi:hypothetical protein